MSGVVLVLVLVRSLLLVAWSRLWSTHAMHATELNDEVESEVQATAVSVREFRCENRSGHTSLLLNRGIDQLYVHW